MIDSISRKLTQRLLDFDIIDFDDIDVYLYGLQLLLATIFKGIGLIIIGIALDCILEMAIFILFFSPLRVFAGGFHNKTYNGCFLLTNFAVLISIYLSRVIVPLQENSILFCGLVISIVLIFLYAPVDNPNRSLSDVERPIYRKKALSIVIIQSFIVIGIVIFKLDFIIYAYIATFAILCESISLLPVFNNRSISDSF